MGGFVFSDLLFLFSVDAANVFSQQRWRGNVLEKPSRPPNQLPWQRATRGSLGGGKGELEREEEEEECRLLEGLQGRWGLGYAVAAAER